MHVKKPIILHKPPHTVHKVLKGSSSAQNSTTNTTRWQDNVSLHPYKHAAAAIASSPGDDDDDGPAAQQEKKRSSTSLFGIAGVIGGAEYDPYHNFRHDLYLFKEQLAHEINKLVLEKQELDKLKRRAAAAASQQHEAEEGVDSIDDDENNDDDDDDDDNDDDDNENNDDDDDTLVGDDDSECLLSSSSTLVDDEDEDAELTD